MQFPLSIAMPDNIAGQSLAFKTLEYYSNGVVARWIGPPSAAYPSPTINVTAKGGVIEDVAGGEAGPTPGVPTLPRGPTTATGQKSHSSGQGPRDRRPDRRASSDSAVRLAALAGVPSAGPQPDRPVDGPFAVGCLDAARATA